ncbi:MAG: hypothetical protein ABSH16_04890 [Sedimentisphaerales bacterium]
MANINPHVLPVNHQSAILIPKSSIVNRKSEISLCLSGKKQRNQRNPRLSSLIRVFCQPVNAKSGGDIVAKWLKIRVISEAGPCASLGVLGLVRKAYGLRGQGERVSQIRVSRIPLAAERLAEQIQCNPRQSVIKPSCFLRLAKATP